MRFPTNPPIDTKYSIPFGATDNAAKFGKHAGIDINVPIGTNVYAPVSGVITPYISGVYHGQVVEILGDDGHYHHMFHNSKLLARPGNRVSEGQLVGISGASGLGVTGSHVHYGVAKKSVPNITSFSDFTDPNSLKEEKPMPNEGDVHNAYLQANGRKATPEEVKVYTSKPWNAKDGLYYGKVRVDFDNAKNATPGNLVPVTEQLYKKG